MEFPHDLPYSEVKDLLQAIIRRRTERNTHDKDSHQYRMIDERLDELLELLAQQFMSAPTRGTERFPETLPPAEDEGEFHPIDESNFDPVEELRLAVPDSKNETPADLDTTPSVEDTPEQIKERDRLTKLFETGGNKISTYSMKPSLYSSLKKAPSQLFRSISSVSKKVNPFMKSKKSKKSKKTKKYRKN
jgi:hypothetical protein